MNFSLQTRTAPEHQGVGRENEIYTKRFTPVEDRTREITWSILVQNFLQQYVNPGDTVIDLAAGEGQFIRNIKAGRRIAVDLSPHVRALEKQGIEVHQVPATDFADACGVQADVIFMSNFLEHLPEKKLVLEVFEECRKALKPGGLLLVLQPNIRYVGNAYWDYIDHHIALTEYSLKEALEVSGFEIVRMIPRFLPYTAKSKVGHLAGGGSTEWFVRTYLNFPILWRLFGKQTFVAAKVLNA